LLLAATVRSFAHMPLGISDRNNTFVLIILINGCIVRNTAERSFSKLRLIKTLHRSTITDESLTNLVIVSIESETFTALVAKTLDMTD